jgi:raffinose/stachyose/melibiose transport system substrate-binding protein
MKMKTMTTRTTTWVLSGVAIFAAAVPALAADTMLTIESWRNDDLPIWQEKIIPVFEK